MKLHTYLQLPFWTRISLIIEFRVDGSKPRCFAMSILLNFGVLSTSVIMFTFSESESTFLFVAMVIGLYATNKKSVRPHTKTGLELEFVLGWGKEGVSRRFDDNTFGVCNKNGGTYTEDCNKIAAENGVGAFLSENIKSESVYIPCALETRKKRDNEKKR